TWAESAHDGSWLALPRRVAYSQADVTALGEGNHANPRAPDTLRLYSDGLDHAAGAGHRGQSPRPAVVYGAHRRPPGFEPSRDGDEERAGAQYHDVRALRRRSQRLQGEPPEQASRDPRPVLGSGRTLHPLSPRHGSTRSTVSTHRLSAAEIGRPQHHGADRDRGALSRQCGQPILAQLD